MAPGIRISHRKIQEVSWNLLPNLEEENYPADYTLVDNSGNTVTKDMLLAAVNNEVHRLNADGGKLGAHRIKIVFGAPGINIRDNQNGADYAVKTAIATVQYEVTEELSPFSLLTYENKETGNTITEAAVANVSSGAISGKIMIVYKQSEGGTVVFVPDGKKD